MISQLAISEIDRLRGEGFDLTPFEMIRINSFGCKVEYGERSSTIYHRQRCAFVGDVVFQEPTIGHDIWFERVEKVLDTSDNVTSFTIRAYMLAHDQDELPTVESGIQIMEKVLPWVQDNLRKYTPRQILNAMYYVTYGNSAEDSEQSVHYVGDDDKKVEQEDKFDWQNTSIALGLIFDGYAHRLGITYADACRMTKEQLEATIIRSEMIDQKYDGKSEKNKALADYYRVVSEIEENHKKNKVIEDGRE